MDFLHFLSIQLSLSRSRFCLVTWKTKFNSAYGIWLILTLAFFIFKHKWQWISAFDEGERLLFASPARDLADSVLDAMRFHGLGAILDWLAGTFCLDLMCSVFLARELVSILWLVHRWNISEFVYYRFVHRFSHSFQLSLFFIGKAPF